MRTQTLTQPTTHHAQPGHETSHVRAPETQKQQAHARTTPDQVQVEKKRRKKERKAEHPICDVI